MGEVEAAKIEVIRCRERLVAAQAKFNRLAVEERDLTLQIERLREETRAAVQSAGTLAGVL